MSAEAILRLVVGALDDLGIPYMLTGSLASAYYGAPRSTQDVDLVVDAVEDELQRLGDRLRDAGLYVDRGAISEAVRARGLFNAVDTSTGWKADFILVKSRPFSRTEFSDRVASHIAGMPLTIVRAEDIVVAKLEWAKETRIGAAAPGRRGRPHGAGGRGGPHAHRAMGERSRLGGRLAPGSGDGAGGARSRVRYLPRRHPPPTVPCAREAWRAYPREDP